MHHSRRYKVLQHWLMSPCEVQIQGNEAILHHLPRRPNCLQWLHANSKDSKGSKDRQKYTNNTSIIPIWLTMPHREDYDQKLNQLPITIHQLVFSESFFAAQMRFAMASSPFPSNTSSFSPSRLSRRKTSLKGILIHPIILGGCSGLGQISIRAMECGVGIRSLPCLLNAHLSMMISESESIVRLIATLTSPLDSCNQKSISLSVSA